MRHQIVTACRFLLAVLFPLWWSADVPAAALSTIQFSTTNYFVSETARVATITVVRSAPLTGIVSVDFTTADDGDAVPGLDYYPTNGTLTFSNGVSSLKFSVPILDDALHEPKKPIILELSHATNATFGVRVTAELTMLDSDPCGFTLTPPSVTLGPAAVPSPSVTSLTINVVGVSGCPWTAMTTTNWIPRTVTNWIGFPGSVSGDGSGMVSLTVDSNLTTVTRTARLLIAGKPFVLTQKGHPPPDSNGPIVTVTSPLSNGKLTNANWIVKGTARDHVEVSRVEYWVENVNGLSLTNDAIGTTNWLAPLNGLAPGTNTVRVRAWDRTNNPSATVARTFFYSTVSLLTVTNEGRGSVTPLLGGKNLEVGRGYALTAAPGVNYLFSHWSESNEVVASSARLNFLMRSNLNLTANFVTNPFLAVKGGYNGLFRESDGVRHHSSGLFSAVVMDRGAYTAKLLLGGRTYSASGAFGLNGAATGIATAPGTNRVTLNLQLDLTPGADKLTGHVTDGSWMAELDADRMVPRSTSNYVGRYTVAIFGTDQSTSEPSGDGFGTVLVDAAGNASLAGTLADGTPVAQRVPLSKQGHWPLYAPLYAGRGSILCRVAFDPAQFNSDFSGDFAWNKPESLTNQFYPAGFSMTNALAGSRYAPPPGTTNRVLTFNDGGLAFSGGNLGAAFHNDVILRPNNTVTNAVTSTNRLVFTIVKPTGLFTGTVIEPGANRTISFKGALLKKADLGAGFFLGTDQSGRVRFGPSFSSLPR